MGLHPRSDGLQRWKKQIAQKLHGTAIYTDIDPSKHPSKRAVNIPVPWSVWVDSMAFHRFAQRQRIAPSMRRSQAERVRFKPSIGGRQDGITEMTMVIQHHPVWVVIRWKIDSILGCTTREKFAVCVKRVVVCQSLNITSMVRISNDLQVKPTHACFQGILSASFRLPPRLRWSPLHRSRGTTESPAAWVPWCLVTAAATWRRVAWFVLALGLKHDMATPGDLNGYKNDLPGNSSGGRTLPKATERSAERSAERNVRTQRGRVASRRDA